MHRYTGSFERAIHYAPLTMTTIAGILESMGFCDVEIYDETIETIPKDLEADLVMITVITGTAPRSYTYARYFMNRGMTVVLGGVHPTLMPDEAKAYCNSVLMGFAEDTVPEMIADFGTGALKPFYISNSCGQGSGSGIRMDHDGDFAMGAPRRRLLKSDRYITSSTLEATRGCSNSCAFCAVNALYGSMVYRKTIREVVEEVEQMKTKNVLFVDVNLIADREYAVGLFKALIPLKNGGSVL